MNKRSYSACLVMLGLLACVASQAHAQTDTVWNNAGTGDWATAANWDDDFGTNRLPDGNVNENAVINNGGTAFVASTISPSPGSVNLTGGSRLEIRTGGVLQVDGNTLVNESVRVGGNSVLDIQGNGTLEAASLDISGGTLEYNIGSSLAAIPISLSGTTPADLNLGGNLNLNFSSNPAGGSNLTLLRLPTSAVGTQDFSGVNIAGSNAQSITTGFIDIGGGNSELQASVTNLLTLRVNRDTGNASIENTHSSGINFDAYAIESVLGSLNGSGLTPGLGAGWTVSPSNNANGVSELNQNGSTSATGVTQVGTGLFSAATPTEFRESVEDLTFQYRSNGTIVEGVVVYEGTPTFNDIVLTIDGTGAANLKNISSFTQEVDGYRITSSDDSLTFSTWTSLQDAGVDDGSWREAPAGGSASSIAELQGAEDSSTTFDRFITYDLGTIFNGTGSEEGITFEYLLAGDSQFTEGTVFFGALPPADERRPGDFDGDEDIDGADFLAWQRGFGTTFDASDLADWQGNYGVPANLASSLAAVAVPEPGCGLLLLVGLSLLVVQRKLC